MKSKTALLTCLNKRSLLNDPDAGERELITAGDRFMAEGMQADALRFFSKAHHTEGMEEILSRALQEGDLFLYRAAAEALGRKPEPGDYREVGRTALEAGKLFFARAAYREASDESMQEQVEQRIRENGFDI